MSDTTISTTEGAALAVKSGLASCYGIDLSGRAWIGFGHSATLSERPLTSLWLPATHQDVAECQSVQQRWLARKRRDEAQRDAAEVVQPLEPAANDPVAHGVERGGGETWCGLPWGSSYRLTNDRERVSCPGCRAKAIEPASEATVEAEIRRACAAYPEIGEVVFGRGEWDGNECPTANGMTYGSSASTYDQLRHKAALIAGQLATRASRARAEGPCEDCTLSSSWHCPACSGAGS